MLEKRSQFIFNTNPSLIGLILIIVLSFIYPSVANANFSIIDGNTKIFSDKLSIDAECDLDLSADVEEALNNGIALHFVIQFRLYLVRPFIWDSHLADWERHYVLKYHSLSDQYLLINNTTNEQEPFLSVREAMDSFSDFKVKLPVVTKTLPQNDYGYRMGMRIRLNKEKLPSPLKLLVEISPSWNLDSSWYQWSVAN